MNVQQWRQLGYKTIFRSGFVYLYRPLTGVTIVTEVRGGEWMQHDNVNVMPWHVLPNGESDVNGVSLRRIAKHCYCDEGCSTCDFCSGTRTVREFFL